MKLHPDADAGDLRTPVRGVCRGNALGGVIPTLLHPLGQCEEIALRGRVTFHFRNILSGEFIPTTFKSKWEEWRHKWLYICVDSFHYCLADPETAVVHNDTFKELSS